MTFGDWVNHITAYTTLGFRLTPDKGMVSWLFAIFVNTILRLFSIWLIITVVRFAWKG